MPLAKYWNTFFLRRSKYIHFQLLISFVKEIERKSESINCPNMIVCKMKKKIWSFIKNVCSAIVILSLIYVFSCSSTGVISHYDTEKTDDTWIIPDGPLQTLRNLTWDLRHQKLWVRFNFQDEEVLGRTEMLFLSEKMQDELVFDAKTMRFDSIYDVRSGTLYSFQQDSAIVTVALGRQFSIGDTLVLGISFVSSPPGRGLYFVNPRGEDPVKPTQIWTLGQPEDNSFWFPTIDHPAERTTQETWISVPPQFQTLSNGILLDSRTENGDSLRTDYWKLHQPHAPYLFAIAAGEYEIYEEIQDEIVYRYYVEPMFMQSVTSIYENTVDMVRFSEKKLDMPYPWDPVYAQVPVHDFIARGMENTTATILYDAVQFDKRAAKDLSNQDLIMHEIIHQWLGNLITAKDWANLPLNEGFANYFESAYRKYNNGMDEYLWKNHEDRLRYFNESQDYRRPIIFYNYQIPEDMYDRHTYQKAGQVLRMLHDYLGDDIWWQGVRNWVKTYSFDAVDIFDLKENFEEAGNKDLYWFFDQWFFKPGHPSLEITREIFQNEAILTIRQVQDTRQPLFTLYPEVLIVLENSVMHERIRIDGDVQEFHFRANRPILDVIVDPDRVQLAQYLIDIGPVSLGRRLNSNHLLVRAEALSLAHSYMEEPEIRHAIRSIAENDKYWGMRMYAYEIIAENVDYFTHSEFLTLAKRATYDREESFRARRAALELLRFSSVDKKDIRKQVRDHLIKMMDDPSYFVAADAIRLTGLLFPEESASLTGLYIGIPSYQNVLRNAVAEALTGSQEKRSMELLRFLAAQPGDKQYSTIALTHIVEQIRQMDDSEKQVIKPLFTQRLHDPYKRYRMLAYEGISELVATDLIEDLKEAGSRSDLDKDEIRLIRDTIRILEYNRIIGN